MSRQKRSTNTYQKINTLFKRDIDNIIMPHGSLVDETLDYLRESNIKFVATEKIDGTNIRLEVSSNVVYETTCSSYNVEARPEYVEFTLSYKGKTDNAQIPKHLEVFLKENYPEEKVLAAFGLKKQIHVNEWNCYKWGVWVDTCGDGQVFEPDFSKIPSLYTIYGEGYGVKIQSGGNYIKDGVGFIVFDVKVNDTYLLRENMLDITQKLGAPTVPLIGFFTIDEAIDFVSKGFKSTIAENKEYLAEGLVLTTSVGLKDRRGDRIIFKIKTCDFVKYRQKYGTDIVSETIEWR